MKKLIVASLILFNVFFSVAQGVAFEDLSVEQAVEKAQKENKYIFVDVYTDWCSPCKLMDKQVFPLKELGDYFNPKFVSLKINAEKGEVGPQFANKYKIKAYPTFVILDNKGDLVHIFAGGILEPQKFINKVSESFDSEKAYGILKQRYDSGERDIKLVSNYLQVLISTHTVKPDELVEEFYNSLTDDEKVSNEALFIYEMFAPLKSDKANLFEEKRDQFREVVGTEKIDAILVAKYELYFGSVVRGYGKATIEDINATWEHVLKLGISNLKTLPVFKSAAVLTLTNEGKETVLKEIENAISNLTEREKDLMLYIVVPGLKDILTEKEKENLIKLVTDEGVKGYIIRSAY